jgi:hypothetical protein
LVTHLREPASAVRQVSPLKIAKAARRQLPSRHHSVGAGVRPSVWRVVRASKVVAVIAAASETTCSIAKSTLVSARHATSAKASHVSAAEATHATSTEAAHLTSATATHVTSAATAATTSSATACLCTRRKQSPGKQDACQYHRRSSSHDISFRAISDHLTPCGHMAARLRIANGKFRRQ